MSNDESLVVWAEEGGIQLRTSVVRGSMVLEVLDVNQGVIGTVTIAHYRAQRVVDFVIAKLRDDKHPKEQS